MSSEVLDTPVKKKEVLSDISGAEDLDVTTNLVCKCGLFVCKYTKDLLLKNDVSSSYTASEVDDIRVEIANAVFSDPPRSWQMSSEVLDTPVKKKEVLPDIFGAEDLDVTTNSVLNNGDSITEVMESTILEVTVIPIQRRLRSRGLGYNDLLALSNDGPSFKIGLSQM
ncbi:hypothetical protein ACHQM5_013728 [Ranunculus cassubicifolius]